MTDFRRPPRDPDIEAEITMVATEAGGRQFGAFSGYRPNHDFGLGELNDAMHEYLEEDPLPPGSTGRAHIWLLAPERQVHRLHEGFPFTVQEGARIVATAKITRVVNSDLRADRLPTYLFTVTDVFEIADRYIVLAPGAPPTTKDLKNDSPIQLRFPDGRSLDTAIGSIPILDPYDPERPVAIALSRPHTKDSIPIGTEVWLR